MSQQYQNMSIRNLTYRLRRFKDLLDDHLDSIIMSKSDLIVSAVVDDQLYRRGVNGRNIKIWDYKPYRQSTIKRKQKKGQPSTRVTLRDTGAFHKSVKLVRTSSGYYLKSSDKKAEVLIKKYGPSILRISNENLNRILNSHIRKELVKRLRQQLKQT